ncbi:hypothetical protein D3C81_1770720 [compost metagenome]
MLINAVSNGCVVRTILTMMLAPSQSWYRFWATVAGASWTASEPSATPLSMAPASRLMIPAVPRCSEARMLAERSATSAPSFTARHLPWQSSKD